LNISLFLKEGIGVMIKKLSKLAFYFLCLSPFLIVGTNLSAVYQVWGIGKSDACAYYKSGTIEDSYDASGDDWEKAIPDTAKYTKISVGPSGQIWALNANGQIYCRIYTSNYTSGGWKNVVYFNTDKNDDLKLSDISVGPEGQIWGLDKNDNIYYRVGINTKILTDIDGINTYNPFGTGWKLVDGKLKRISVGANGQIWGLNAAGNIFYRTEISDSNPFGTGWTHDTTFTHNLSGVGEKLTDISVGSNVWVGTAWGKLYYKSGTGWLESLHEGARLSKISAGTTVGSRKQVWGINANGAVYRRNDASANKWPQISSSPAISYISFAKVPDAPSLTLKYTLDTIIGTSYTTAKIGVSTDKWPANQTMFAVVNFFTEACYQSANGGYDIYTKLADFYTNRSQLNAETKDLLIELMGKAKALASLTTTQKNNITNLLEDMKDAAVRSAFKTAVGNIATATDKATTIYEILAKNVAIEGVGQKLDPTDVVTLYDAIISAVNAAKTQGPNDLTKLKEIFTIKPDNNIYHNLTESQRANLTTASTAVDNVTTDNINTITTTTIPTTVADITELLRDNPNFIAAVKAWRAFKNTSL
jgi:hypothetical protein